MKKINNVLIEIGMEELPYKNLNKISNSVKAIIANNLKIKNINFYNIKNLVTLRRLAFIIHNIKIKDNLDIENIITSIIEKTLTEATFKVKMRWNINVKEFIRPIKWYILMINKKLINHSIFGIKSQKYTVSHKSSQKKLLINSDTYEKVLKKRGHVICDQNKRKNIVLNLIKLLAKKLNSSLILKRKSICDITNIIEYPLLIECKFKKKFLNIPAEIITTTLLKNQFCILLEKKHKLINKLIIIADSFKNKKNIKHGYNYIIDVKLSEIQFMYFKEKNYLKNTKIYELKKLTLDEKLGNMYDKTYRIINLVKILKKITNKKHKNLLLATKLIKMDFLTKIVTEMPDLNGLISGYNIENEKIRTYLINYNKILNNNIKYNKSSALMVIADKIDNITSHFIINKKPTGSKDPFNLKKDAKIILKTIIKNKIDINLLDLISNSIKQHIYIKNLDKEILNFILQRLNYEKDNIFFIKNKTNVFKIYLQTNAIKNLLKYNFKNLLLSGIKRIIKITNKNKISMQQKLNKDLLINKQEKIILNKIKKHIKKINILNKKNLFFESIKTQIVLEKDIAKYFNSVLIIDKNNEIKQTRLKLLNLIKKIISSTIKFDELIFN